MVPASVVGSFQPVMSLDSPSDQTPTDATAPRRGRFIVFEGGDGSGKSTHAKILAEDIGARLTREPGGTPVGEKIREVVLNAAHPELADRTEALLMAAGRAQHVAELIVPTLESGRHVVCDRFVASSLAYQGVGRGLGVDAVLALNDFGTAGLKPDLIVLLDIPSEVAFTRLDRTLDRIESAGGDLADRVRQTYLDLAAADPERWVVVDGTRPVDDVSEFIAKAVVERLGQL